MKTSLFSFIFGGLVLTVILQAVLFASTGMQSNRLQKQLTDISGQLNKLQTISETALNSSTKSNKEVVLGSTTQNSDQNQDPNNLLTPEKLSQTLGSSEANTVKLKVSLKNADTFETTKTSSHVTGQLIPGTAYPILSKQTDWYLIKLDTQTNAWVQAEKVNEAN